MRVDYIQEELLRQKRALEALMIGGVRQTEETAESTERNRLHSVQEPEGMLRGRMTAVRSAAGGKRRGLRIGTSEAAESGRVWRGSAAQEAVAGGADRDVRWMSRSQIAQVDVQEISRTIQRDARRYDGGFSLY